MFLSYSSKILNASVKLVWPPSLMGSKKTNKPINHGVIQSFRKISISHSKCLFIKIHKSLLLFFCRFRSFVFESGPDVQEMSLFNW